VAAGVHGRDGKTIAETSRAGVAAVCTKTIVSQPAKDVLPCFVKVEGGMLNSVFGTDRTAEYWFTEGIQTAKGGDALVIANLAGFTPEESAELALKAEKAGADMIELPTHCPHMGEILNAMFPGLNYPEPKLTDVEPMKRAVRLMKRAVKVPVIVKLSGTFAHIVKEWAVAVKEAGADAIACSDAFGPAIAIDIRTGRPRLGGPRGGAGLTGPAIKPLVLRMVLDIALTGFLEGEVLVPRFVVEELQHLADSADAEKRVRGRRGLDFVRRLQSGSGAVRIDDKDYADIEAVDAKLVRLARDLGAQIVTTDYTLKKVAEIQGVKVLNVNDLANSVKPAVRPGEVIEVKILREGREQDQGVGYLDDGTMIVVESGALLVGSRVKAEVTSVLQSPSGKMIFSRVVT
jgi:dihydroorotate dehydrogenase